MRRVWPLICCLAAVLLAHSFPAQTAEPVLQFTHAEFVQSEATEPPSDSADWKPQQLPDNWASSRPNVQEGHAWYRLPFDLPRQPDQPYALYSAIIRTEGTLYANGALVGATNPFGTIQRVRRPQFLVISPNLLRAGPNTLHIRILAAKGYSKGLAQTTVGPEAVVRPQYEDRYFWSQTCVELICLAAALFALFSFMLWVRRPHETLYGYFGLAALCWTVFLAGGFVAYPPIPRAWWSAILETAGHAKVPFMALFALRYAGWYWPKTERWLWLWMAISAFIHFSSIVAAPDGVSWVEHWDRTWFLATAFVVIVLAVSTWRNPTPRNILVAITAAVHPLLSAYYELFPLPFEKLNPIFYDFIPMQLVLGWILVDRFVQSINDTEKLNAELEQRVAQKHAELQRNYQKMQQMERDRAIVEERARIMSDMHDGIGGQLISTLSLVEHGEASSDEVAAALRECIDDLRIAIDSLEPTENDLLPVLGNLRYRLEGRLKKQGIALDWQVKEVPKLACLTPQNVLHILRILQEAFTNVLKHAHASLISVETGLDGGNRVFIRVRDNGNGFAGDHKGRGLDNMQRRARTVGGDLQIQPSPAGTTLNLLLPVG